MAKRFLYLIGFVLVLVAAGNAPAEELGDYYVIEDFERYSAQPGDPNYIKDFWKCRCCYYDLVFDYPHGGIKAVGIQYWTKDPPYDCGVGRTETPWIPEDWTFAGEAETLSLWFRVNDEIIAPTNNADELYVTLTDTSNRTATVQYSDRWDPNTIQVTGYHEWNIELSEFTDVIPLFDLTHVKDIEMGIGDGLGSPPTIPGEGDLFFDDIRLYPRRCILEYGQPEADINDDCVVDWNDVKIVADDWLEQYSEITPPDLNEDLIINFLDYQILADGWLEDTKFPFVP